MAGHRADQQVVPPIDISTLAPGHYQRVDMEASHRGFGIVLLVRDADGTLYVYGFAKANGRAVMPGKTWNSSFSGYCNDLRPDGASGVLAAGAVITCQDRDYFGKTFAAWRWTLQGKSLSPDTTADLYAPKFDVNGNFLVVKQR